MGPLHADQEYLVSAEMDGYVMTGDNKGNFHAFKLGEIQVKVTDESGTPLSGVLLSLSGGGAAHYRSNQQTPGSGDAGFTRLSPGEYFLRPLMKEYRFSPASRLIEVTEGSTVTLDVIGVRTAYSTYGAVTSLSGEAEAGVFVEARCRSDGATCPEHQEEAKTDSNGAYRIRGLVPGCTYDISVRGTDVNPHIERTAPAKRTVKVGSSDIHNQQIIAFRHFSQMDLSGNVITPSQHLPTIKVVLFKERAPDSAIHSLKLETTSFFHLPSLPIDDQVYILRLVTSLSRSAYTFTTPEITFSANQTYSHFTFQFEPKAKTVEQELNVSSFLIVPLTIIVVLLFHNSKQVAPYVHSMLDSIQAMLTGTPARSPSPPPSTAAPGSADLLLGAGAATTHQQRAQNTKVRRT